MNNEINNQRKVIIMSLSGLLIGSLLFVFGLSISSSLWPLVIHDLIASLLYISSFLALYHQYKKEKYAIFIYIMILAVFMIILINAVAISQFL